MSIRVVFLGTSGSVPTLKRSLPAVVVQCPQTQWMFDCGENVQHQMMGAKVSFHRKMKIFISHLHGDHVLGLPGLLQTMALMERKEPPCRFTDQSASKSSWNAPQKPCTFCVKLPS